MRHAQRGVADFARFFAEDGTQQAFFRGQLGFALRRDLADQDIARADFGADADNAASRRGRAAASSPTFGISRVISSGPSLVSRASHLVFFDMDGGEDVVADNFFADQDGVFVVVAFPGHKADQDILAERNLPVFGRRGRRR